MGKKEAMPSGEGVVKKFYLKQEWFERIRSGDKTVELRIAYESFKKIGIGDRVEFRNNRDEIVNAKITDVHIYDNLKEAVSIEDLESLAPGMVEKDFLLRASELFSESDIKQHGLILFEFTKVT